MASPTPSLESRANSLGSPVSLSPVTVSGSSPPASDSAICDVDSCDLCLDAPKSGEDPCPRCRLGSTGGTSRIRCTGCKSGSTEVGAQPLAVARCYDCDQFLCPNCVMAHQYMLCFEGHRLLNLADSKLETVAATRRKHHRPLFVPIVARGGDRAERHVVRRRRTTRPYPLPFRPDRPAGRYRVPPLSTSSSSSSSSSSSPSGGEQ